MEKIIETPILRFLGVGIINVLITLIIIFFLKEAFGTDDAPANLIGYAAGLLSSFTLNKRWTFGDGSATLTSFLRFLIVFAVAYLLNIFTVLTAIRTGTPNYLAHIIGMPIYTITFYLGCRVFAFPSLRASYILAEFRQRHFALSANPPHAAQETKTANAWPWLIGVVFFSSIILYYRIGENPIYLWDESRLANNALEMSESGLSLVPTYNMVPDHWNTKPPLLIWAMSMAIDLLGPSETAVRLPSTLCALATGIVLFSICAWHFGRPALGFFAVLLLYSTPGYVLFHGARSGDYEAMLTLWMLGYVTAGYLMFKANPAHTHFWLTISALMMIFSFLTKTLQGMIMVPPLFAYIAIQIRAKSRLQWKCLIAATILVALVCGGYYLLREQVDPGYFKAAQANDLAGRYMTVIEHHTGDWRWYLSHASQGKQYPWLIPSFIVAALQLRYGSATARPIVLLFTVVSMFYLLVISSAHTKLVWYATPLSPFSATVVAIGVTDLAKTICGNFSSFAEGVRSIQGALLWAVSAAVILINLNSVNDQIAMRTKDDLDSYSIFLRSPALEHFPNRGLAVIHPGYPNEQKDPFYIAPTLFYIKGLQMEGRRIVALDTFTKLPRGIDAVLACGSTRSQVEHSIPGISKAMKHGICNVYVAQP